MHFEPYVVGFSQFKGKKLLLGQFFTLEKNPSELIELYSTELRAVQKVMYKLS